MILALIVLLPILVLSLWWFCKLSPRDAEQRLVWLYNIAVLVVGVLICAGLTLRLQATLADTPDRAWWPVLSAIFSLLVLPLWIAVCGVVRNLLVFRSGQGPG
jgi:cytochrome bd-type quinol oxidase subunit 2